MLEIRFAKIKLCSYTWFPCDRPVDLFFPIAFKILLAFLTFNKNRYAWKPSRFHKRWRSDTSAAEDKMSLPLPGVKLTIVRYQLSSITSEDDFNFAVGLVGSYEVFGLFNLKQKKIGKTDHIWKSSRFYYFAEPVRKVWYDLLHKISRGNSKDCKVDLVIFWTKTVIYSIGDIFRLTL